MRRIILVIDDLESNRDIYSELLESKFKKFKVKTVESIDNAYDFLKENSHLVSTILTDMNMNQNPKEGLKFIESMVRKINQTNNESIIPIIVVTAYENKEIERKCIKFGCFDFLVKPYLSSEEVKIFQEELLKSVTNAVELSKSKRNWQLPIERLILENWIELSKEIKDSIVKGKLLEELVEDIFGNISDWNRYKTNVIYEYEEIDMLIFNHKTDNFWSRYGGDIILVECKNWKDRPQRSVFDAFHGMITRRKQDGCRLGFVISLNGFTKGFVKASKQVPTTEGIVACLDGNDLWQLIISDDRSKFLEQIIVNRNIMK